MGHNHGTTASSFIYAATTLWLSFMAKDKVTVTDDIVNRAKRTGSNRNKRSHEQYQIEQPIEATIVHYRYQNSLTHVGSNKVNLA
jgi:hypothetical protein